MESVLFQGVIILTMLAISLGLVEGNDTNTSSSKAGNTLHITVLVG